MKNLPVYISIFFVLTTLLTVWLFYRATKKSTITIIVLLSWLAVQMFIALTGFYLLTTSTSRFPFLIIPPIVFIIILFIVKSGRKYIDNLDIKMLTILQTIRIPVELLLFCLFINGKIPKIMTFEGRNFDMLAGLSAPVIYYFGYIKNTIGKNILIGWNFICLGLLLNIVIIAVLSAPFSFQQFGFEQPNIAIFYFPFIWLPCCVVPLVLFSHLISLKHLLTRSDLPFNK
ncbi:MAG TPA: hypothetical protein VK559_03545 [Ferruginibacter sp.]|nr:hypothetical protein [Ferruginibacter sp.]